MLSGNESVIGAAWIPANFIEVNFRWLIVPIVLWLLTTIFIIATIFMTWKLEAPLWKSSVLALLRSQDEHGASSSVKGMDRDARKIEVQLTRNEDAWWLASVDPTSLKED